MKDRATGKIGKCKFNYRNAELMQNKNERSRLTVCLNFTQLALIIYIMLISLNTKIIQFVSYGNTICKKESAMTYDNP